MCSIHSKASSVSKDDKTLNMFLSPQHQWMCSFINIMVNKKCCLVIFQPNNSWTLKIKFWRHLPFIFLISVFLVYGFIIWFWWVVNTQAQLPLWVTFPLLLPCSELWSRSTGCLQSDTGIFTTGRYSPGKPSWNRAPSPRLADFSHIRSPAGRWSRSGGKAQPLKTAVLPYHKSQDMETT